ncbi:MAG: flagellar hook-length control protein FliK [Pseudomonadota bacterium]
MLNPILPQAATTTDQRKETLPQTKTEVEGTVALFSAIVADNAGPRIVFTPPNAGAGRSESVDPSAQGIASTFIDLQRAIDGVAAEQSLRPPDNLRRLAPQETNALTTGGTEQVSVLDPPSKQKPVPSVYNQTPAGIGASRLRQQTIVTPEQPAAPLQNGGTTLLSTQTIGFALPSNNPSSSVHAGEPNARPVTGLFAKPLTLRGDYGGSAADNTGGGSALQSLSLAPMTLDDHPLQPTVKKVLSPLSTEGSNTTSEPVWMQQGSETRPNVTAAPRTIAATPQHVAIPSPQATVDQVRLAIQNQGLDTKIEVQLDPPELGRVQIEFEVSRQGSVKASFSAADSTVLDLLKRNSDSFLGDLSQEGFDDIEFDWSDDLEEQVAWTGENTKAGAETPDPEPSRIATIRYADGNLIDLSL